jgi:hypothetical protein
MMIDKFEIDLDHLPYLYNADIFEETRNISWESSKIHHYRLDREVINDHQNNCLVECKNIYETQLILQRL